MNEITLKIPDGYEVLATPLQAAINRCALGKGKERHQEYEGQPIMDQQIARFSKYWRHDQIQKKSWEAENKLKTAKASEEVLDIIVLAAVEWLKLNRELMNEEASRKARKAISEVKAFAKKEVSNFDMEREGAK